LTTSGIFWEKDEVRRRREKGGVVQRISSHTIQISHYHIIYIDIKEGKGVERKEISKRGEIPLKKRQVDRVEFPKRRNK
jgi:hypothetical protein